MIQSKSWFNGILLCYVTNMGLVCNVHADVLRPSMAAAELIQRHGQRMREIRGTDMSQSAVQICGLF